MTKYVIRWRLPVLLSFVQYKVLSAVWPIYLSMFFRTISISSNYHQIGTKIH